MNDVILFDTSVDFAVGAWLDEKSKRSGSRQTEIAYSSDISGFRRALRNVGTDLDGDKRALALVLQAWASVGTTHQPVSSATYNRRLATVSSFYRYCQRHGLLGDRLDNPVLLVERRPVQRYAHAVPLATNFVQARLKRIDVQSLPGLRDKALLLIGVTTGRRVSEMAALTWVDLQGSTLTFQHAKGGKVMRDMLEPEVLKLLKTYESRCREHFGHVGQMPSNYPIWVSFAQNGTYGKQLSVRSLQNICQARLSTSKFHTLRHTFAHEMENAGAKVSTIAARLGHENIATTGKYLTALASDENPFASSLVLSFLSGN